jgi:bacterioferritin
MTIDREATLIAHVPPRGAQRLGADGGFADAVTGRLQSAAESSAHRPEQDVLVKMLNDAWDAEAASRLQGEHQDLVTQTSALPKAGETRPHEATDAWQPQERLAQSLGQVGGAPDGLPDDLTCRADIAYGDLPDLSAMIKTNLVAEGAAIDGYCQILTLVGGSDVATRRLIEDILIDEIEHADELWQ